MALKLGTKTIGNACLGDKQLSAIFLGDKLIWSAGVKLQSLLGRQNIARTREWINITFYPTTDGSFDYADSGNLRKVKRVANHTYFIFANIELPTYEWVYFGLWDTSSTGYSGNRTNAIAKVGNHMFGVITPTQGNDNAVCVLQFGSTTSATINNAFVLDLTASKLDQFSATQIYNLLTLNGTDFTNLEKLADGYAVKCGEFKVENNAIKGTKYGIVDLGTLNYFAQDASNGRFGTVGIQNVVKKPSSSSAYNEMNLYCDKFVVGSVSLKEGNVMQLESNGAFDIKSADFIGKTPQEIKSLLSGVYLIFELATPLGSKLDNYNAEQAYNLLIGTAPSTKLPYPNGVKFEMNGNAIKGTKYGIMNLGSLTWGRNSGTIWKYSNITSLGSVQWGASDIANIHCGRYKTDYASTSPDKSISIFSGGGNVYLRISDSAFEDSVQGIEDIKKSLNGVYMIYELATPDGTDYSDLTAKQMFDLINTDKLGVLAGGKSFDGNRSLLGKQNIATELDTTGYSWLPYIFPTNNNSFRLENNAQETNQKKRHFIANHKYFICVSIKDGSISVGNGWFNVENGNIFNDIKQNGNDYFAVANCGYTGDGFMVLRANNTMPITPQSCVIIDLTELGLDSLTAQQVYHHFKEYNLKKLKTDNIIKIGGFVK